MARRTEDPTRDLPAATRDAVKGRLQALPHSDRLLTVLEGEVDMDLGGESRRLRPGDAVLIPAWVPHSVRSTGGPVYQLDVFSPPRRALLKLLEAQG